MRTPAVILSLAHLDDDDRVLVLGLPTKAPLVALMKQARAYGVGMVLATQNPMDLDYRALSNAGMWFVGRLQTDADRERVVDGMADAGVSGTGLTRKALSATIKKLAKRWFVLRNVHADSAVLVQPRWAMTWMKGPMTRPELRRALADAAPPGTD